MVNERERGRCGWMYIHILPVLYTQREIDCWDIIFFFLSFFGWAIVYASAPCSAVNCVYFTRQCHCLLHKKYAFFYNLSSSSSRNDSRASHRLLQELDALSLCVYIYIICIFLYFHFHPLLSSISRERASKARIPFDNHHRKMRKGKKIRFFSFFVVSFSPFNVLCFIRECLPEDIGLCGVE